jgi:hypothetical protein
MIDSSALSLVLPLHICQLAYQLVANIDSGYYPRAKPNFFSLISQVVADHPQDSSLEELAFYSYYTMQSHCGNPQPYPFSPDVIVDNAQFNQAQYQFESSVSQAGYRPLLSSQALVLPGSTMDKQIPPIKMLTLFQ